MPGVDFLARTARRMGFTDRNIIYRRIEAEMPANADGKVSGLKCLRMELGEPDKSGRRRPVPVEGSEFLMACDAVIPAIGQACAVQLEKMA